VAGYSDGSFRPNDNIKRQDAAIMLRRLAEQTGVVQGGQPMSFTDYGQISSYARESVDFVSALGIMPASVPVILSAAKNLVPSSLRPGDRKGRPYVPRRKPSPAPASTP
jgi:hypothetical protein